MIVWEVSRKDVEDAMERENIFGAIRPPMGPEDVLQFLGLPVLLWRRLDDGEETVELLFRWIAELTLAAIPHEEPGTRAARLIPVSYTRVDMSSALKA